MSVRSVLDSRHTYIMVSEVETLPLVCYGAHIDRIWIPCCWVGAMHKVPGTQVSYVCLYMYTWSLEHKHIGILEFMTHTFVPRNHELDAEHLLTTVTPLLFSFATRTYLRTERFKTETQQQREKEREKEKEKENKSHQKQKKRYSLVVHGEALVASHRERWFVRPATSSISLLPSPYPIETSKDARAIRKSFRSTSESSWVQRYFSNPYYHLFTNEGGGDCLFACIRDAFESIEERTTVQKLRSLVAECMDDATFALLQEQHDYFYKEQQRLKGVCSRLKEQYAEKQTIVRDTVDRARKSQAYSEAIQCKTQYDAMASEYKVARGWYKDYAYLRGVRTLADMKTMMMTSEYWADAWTLAVLQEKLRIVLLIFHRAYATEGDGSCVLHCCEMTKAMDTWPSFVPDYYLLLSYTGTHYELIGYHNDTVLFTFDRLPYAIRELLVDRCMESQAGLLTRIPDIVRRKARRTAEKEKEKGKQTNPTDEGDVPDDMKESTLRGLYETTVTLQFYSRSCPQPYPGDGLGEHIPYEVRPQYLALSACVNWRRKLSNFWPQAFSLDNHRWLTVEHVWQAAKFKQHHEDFYLTFCLDSGTELSQSPLMAKHAGDPSHPFYRGARLRPDTVHIDPLFYEVTSLGVGSRRQTMSESVLYRALYAKFSQHDDLKELLLHTQYAELRQYRKRSPPVLADALHLVRDEFRVVRKQS